MPTITNTIEWIHTNKAWGGASYANVDNYTLVDTEDGANIAVYQQIDGDAVFLGHLYEDDTNRGRTFIAKPNRTNDRVVCADLATALAYLTNALPTVEVDLNKVYNGIAHRLQDTPDATWGRMLYNLGKGLEVDEVWMGAGAPNLLYIRFANEQTFQVKLEPVDRNGYALNR